jgi:hypothetical protein
MRSIARCSTSSPIRRPDRAVPAPIEELPQELCSVFLGWRLGEDRDALLALGEGTLRIDLMSGESWCDDEPIPALFIAGELKRRIEDAGPLLAARVDAVFGVRTRAGKTTLDVSCRITLETPTGPLTAEAANH